MSWAERRERGSTLGIRFLVACVRWLGLPAARVIIEPIVLYFFLTGPRARRASRAYLERVASSPAGRAALGRRPGAWLVWQHFRAFGHTLLDRVGLWSGATDLLELVFPGRQAFAELESSGRGAVLLGAHLGSFDVLRALAERGGRKIVYVMHQAVTPRINSVLRAVDPALEAHVVQLEPGNIDAVLRLRALSESGHLIAILGDRSEFASRRTQARARFLGAPATFPLGPYLMAGILGVPVHLILGIRTGRNSYEIVLEELADRVGREREQVEAVLQRYADRLEAACLRAPLQWSNFYDFWAQEPPMDQNCGRGTRAGTRA